MNVEYISLSINSLNFLVLRTVYYNRLIYKVFQGRFNKKIVNN